MKQKADPARADRVPFAVTVIVFTVLMLSLGDALIKFTSGEFVIWQIFVLRSLIVLPVLVGLLWWTARDSLSLPPSLGWAIVRSALLVGMWIAYYLALPRLDLSVAAAVYYTLPIFITLFSALFIGDRISAAGWGAVFLGFVGVLLILRPDAGDFNPYALLPLVAAILYALAMILTRTRCRAVHPLMLSLLLNVTFVVAGLVATAVIGLSVVDTRDGFLLGPWAAMGAGEWAAMALLACAILVGSVGAAIAYQNAPPAVIGTFDFGYVAFALVWGFVFFAEVPDVWSLTGMALIVIAGVIALRQ
ncbi:DMT family transporter [Oceaniradius stylonematis]|jgi:drug/metabolite transporter (DMT)-like permease|uniref:DMT family transporter n=1 Tax=Oceaniradius stylonematis TaxID=2184161 RepID=UPI00273CF820|nr:DMT family transporter [Oceaniradius stylonematis]